MSLSTKYRSEAIEIMDDFSLEGKELQQALDKIATINQLLGGNKLTLGGVKKLLENTKKSETITIVDIGCGNGDMLRKIADFGNNNGFNFNLIGIDANAFTINHARNLSLKYNSIAYFCEDIFNMNHNKLTCDIIVCTLTLHHFKNQEITNLLSVFKKSAKMGIVINDLQRSLVSYRLFQLLGVISNLNEMSKRDGQISILRGFKKKDLVDFSEKLNFTNYTIEWKWAFRYQWIIQNI